MTTDPFESAGTDPAPAPWPPSAAEPAAADPIPHIRPGGYDFDLPYAEDPPPPLPPPPAAPPPPPPGAAPLPPPPTAAGSSGPALRDLPFPPPREPRDVAPPAATELDPSRPEAGGPLPAPPTPSTRPAAAAMTWNTETTWSAPAPTPLAPPAAAGPASPLPLPPVALPGSTPGVGPGIGSSSAEGRRRPAPRWAEGAVVGLAAAAVVAGAWWGVVALTKSQFVLLAVAVGFVVGQAVVVGARRGSLALGVYAAAVTLAALAVAEYFIERTLAIQELNADIPLWQGWDFAVDVVRTGLREHPSSFLFWGVAAVAAGIQAANSRARPAL